MSVLKRARAASARRVGLALTGLLTAGPAAASATMLSTTGASVTTAMTDMAQTMSASVSQGHTGFTNGRPRPPRRRAATRGGATPGRRCWPGPRTASRSARDAPCRSRSA